MSCKSAAARRPNVRSAARFATDPPAEKKIDLGRGGGGGASEVARKGAWTQHTLLYDRVHSLWPIDSTGCVPASRLQPPPPMHPRRPSPSQCHRGGGGGCGVRSAGGVAEPGRVCVCPLLGGGGGAVPGLAGAGARRARARRASRQPTPPVAAATPPPPPSASSRGGRGCTGGWLPRPPPHSLPVPPRLGRPRHLRRSQLTSPQTLPGRCRLKGAPIAWR